jgi:uncharacterized protein YwgA
MEPILTGTRDEALIAMVIKDAAELAKTSSNYVGRTFVQKVMYYLKTRGVGMSYKFDIYHYGPYCQEIVVDIEWLSADKVISDSSNNKQKYSNYAPGPAMDELIELNRSSLAANEAVIRETVEALLPLSPDTLELLATLDYVYRAELAKGTKTNLKEATVDQFIEYKKDKYDRATVEEIFDLIVRMKDPSATGAKAN